MSGCQYIYVEDRSGRAMETGEVALRPSFRVSVFEIRVSDSGAGISGLRFRVSGSGFIVSG